MDMNNFRPESHVAQQSRRDKLRVHQQNPTTTTQHLVDYTSNLDVRYTNLPYDTSIFSSEMLNFATNSQILSAQKDAMVAYQESSTTKLDRPLMSDNGLCASSSNFNSSSKSMGVDPQNCSNWKSVGSQQSCDWTVNYSTGYQEEMHFKSLPLYQNTLQEIVTKAPSNAPGGLEMESPVQRSVGDTSIGSWRDNGNELLFIPYGDQSNSLCPDTSFPRINRPVESGFQANKSDSNTQGLSLSLSSVPMTKTYLGQFGNRNDSDHVHSRNVVYNNIHDSKKLNSGCLDVNCEQSIGRNTGQDLVGSSNFAHRNSGPLGPFTGYAIILKNSKFLKPTQQLLDAFCSVSGPKIGETCEASDKIYEEVRVCAHSVQNVEFVVGPKGGDSGTSSSTFRSSNEITGEGGVGRSSSESFQPEYQTKKENLLYMHEEVCKKYKQYHQQIQMVVSSFESVAGLSAATPCVGLALKTVSRHFRCLKNAISEQLGRIRNALGEDLSSPTTGTSSCKGDTSTTSRLNFVDRGFQKHKYVGGSSGGGGNMGFFEPQQHVWRPQRGLPERAVAVLRAWLFDHFLHPYPTDTDKHMLASQTGLSRNQVSNWFINARVRVWKPMVEEIHHLETKGLAEPNSIPSKVDGKPFARTPNRTDDDQMTNRLSIQGMSNNQVECSRDEQSADLWNQEKRSRTEFEIPASTDLSGFVPFERGGVVGGGFEIGGLGNAVSLTLGLRQSAESAQQRQQEHRLRQHFGGQMMIHDFVG